MPQRRLCAIMTLIFLFAMISAATGRTGEPAEYRALLLPDYHHRSSLPQTETPRFEWYRSERGDGWGPMPRPYPGVEHLIRELPEDVDILQWKRDRLIAVAELYLGLPYRHHHIPAFSPEVPNAKGQTGPGLDCSNFTAWVYNFGFGIILNSDINKQAEGEPRRGFAQPRYERIDNIEDLRPADLLYIREKDNRRVSHVAIYIDREHIIDSIGEGVEIRRFAGWYRSHFSHAHRLLF